MATSDNCQSKASETCVICCEFADIHAKYSCNHIICYLCSTRMRVLCNQRQCPVCRAESIKVIFSRNPSSLKDNSTFFKIDQTHGISFQTSDVFHAFEKLHLFPCNSCAHDFKEFSALKHHVRTRHGRHFCDICIKNLKIFPREQKTYTKEELARHRRKGDALDQSHRGHPLCRLCDERYLDEEELAMHMRREHFVCHFCDADGYPEFSINYSQLRRHFKVKHFLCEEDNCVNEQFTSAFRTQLDLQAHRLETHSSNLSRKERERLRQIDVQFQVSRPGFGSQSSGRRSRNYDRRDHFNRRPPEQDSQVNEDAFKGFFEGNEAIPVNQAESINFTLISNTNAVEENSFPSLSKDAAPQQNPRSQWADSVKGGITNSVTNFPTLTQQTTPESAKNPGVPNGNDFPTLSTPASETSAPSWPIKNGRKPKQNNNSINITEASPQHKKKGRKKKNIPASVFDLMEYSSMSLSQLSSELPTVVCQNTATETEEKVVVKNNSSTESKEAVKSKCSMAPPGFEAIPTTNGHPPLSNNAPPGFSQLPSEPYKYIFPENFSERNSRLMSMLHQRMSIEAYEEFKNVSQSFRSNSITSHKYIKHCQHHLGDAFYLVFAELLCLLPDIKLQIQLMESLNSMNPSSQFRGFTSCPTCEQVIVWKDLDQHRQHHSQNVIQPS